MIDTRMGREVRAAIEAARSSALDARALDDLGRSGRGEVATEVALHPSWAEVASLPAHLRERLGVGRADLDEAAARARADGRWAELVAVSAAWGYGRSSYGSWRTARITTLPEVAERLAATVEVLDVEGPVAAYYRLVNEGHLHGWGPASFTRFLAAADLRGAGRAVMLTPAIAAAVNGLLVLDEIAVADWPTVDYAFHHALTHRIAAECGLDVTVVENAWETMSRP
ncbi:hypothetical protein [Nocardioides sp.]|uniref:8-oxoguanine DNA glycosylase OGG fold protein n=1 Tax=Nocardioides sp. TaxID=35761 RepID=UPI00263374CF|nr:hypothetical protein [Nocardioides sp.]